jgi:hypothetical protein
VDEGSVKGYGIWGVEVVQVLGLVDIDLAGTSATKNSIERRATILSGGKRWRRLTRNSCGRARI